MSLAALLLAGCGDSRSSADKAAEQGILIVGNNQEPLSLDPHKATAVADTVNDTYIKANGDERGTASYGEVCDFLVNWHIQTVVLPSQVVEEDKFDPFDESQVDLSGLVHAAKVASDGNEENTD